MTATSVESGVSAEALRPRARWRSHGAELLGVVALLSALELLMFRGYYSGSYAPPWDFLGSYNTEAFAWWNEGSFFRPAEWISHSWGGYPAAVSIQNSAWYLPVGIVSLITPFTIHAAAALAAAHYAFGAAGVYVLGRLSRLGRAPSVFGLVAYFFVAGFYAQAEHVDIARGYAWIPWILAATSPFWPWRRWWAVPLAVIIFWQALLGTYPGMIVAVGYCVVAWVLIHQFTTRTAVRKYLLPLGVSAAMSLLLLAPKYVPALLLDSGASGPYVDASQISWSQLATVFLPYGNPSIPTDIALRSFFLPATCFVLAGLANLRGSLERALLGVLATAVILGLPGTPWHDAVSRMPGLSFSRYRMSDFRSMLLAAICVLAMTALSRIIREAPLAAPARRRSYVRRAAWLAVLPLLLVVLGVANGFDASEWTPALLITSTACVVVALAVLPLPQQLIAYRMNARPAAVVLVLLSLVSGATWAFATTAPWRSPRVYAETASFGATVDELLSERPADTPLEQRPARAPVAEPPVASDIVNTHWNAGFYSDTDSVGGLVNLKRSASFQALQSALLDPRTSDDVNHFMAAPGIVVEMENGQLPSDAEVDSCVSSGECGVGLKVEADGYAPGHLDYLVDAASTSVVAANESYYLGWHVSACATDGSRCVELGAGRGPAGVMIAEVPPGRWKIAFDYITPGSQKSWIAFGAGLALLLAWSAVGAVRSIRRSREHIAS